MTPYTKHKTTALCLVALCCLHTTTNAQDISLAVGEVGEDGYMAIEYLRRGDIPFPLPPLIRQEELIQNLQDIFLRIGSSRPSSCNEFVITDQIIGGFYTVFDASAKEQQRKGGEEEEEEGSMLNVNYRELLQQALTEGLATFGSSYPTEEGWRNIWGKEEGKNILYLLAGSNKGIGCVVGSCTEQKEQNKLFVKAALACKVTPPPNTQEAPFDKDYFNAITGRTKALTDMTPEDLEGKAEEQKKGTGGAAGPAVAAVAAAAATASTILLLTIAIFF